jgi:dTDP-4-dehydrorhamnose reductase
MPNVLVTGSNGQLGSEIRELSHIYKYNFFFTDRADLDISDLKKVEMFIDENGIDAVINCAAYTAVDGAESDKQNADAINHIAAKNLAQIAKDKNIKLIHISTDYVFDGRAYMPYKEEDNTNPNGAYGKTKLDGELAVMAINPANSITIRTSWLYSSYGVNFVKTMLRLGVEKEELGVIYDQVGSPTYAKDLAFAILEILPKIENEKTETYHYSNEGVCSWYDFAKEIMRMAKRECKIYPIETKNYPTPAKRPHYSVLNKSKIKKDFGIVIPYYKDSLDECLRKMGARR